MSTRLDEVSKVAPVDELSVMLLSYFIWGKDDSVGVLANLFPMTVALYNMSMHHRSRSSGDVTEE